MCDHNNGRNKHLQSSILSLHYWSITLQFNLEAFCCFSFLSTQRLEKAPGKMTQVLDVSVIDSRSLNYLMLMKANEGYEHVMIISIFIRYRFQWLI